MMVKNKLLFFCFIFLLFSMKNAFSQEVSAFYVSINQAEQLLNGSTQQLKIDVGIDDRGSLCYLMYVADAQGKPISTSIYLHGPTGDCPPTCDFKESSFGQGSFVDLNTATTYVNNYAKENYPFNAVSICNSAITKVKSKGYPYFKVEFGYAGVYITGLFKDGSTHFFSTFKSDCSTAL